MKKSRKVISTLLVGIFLAAAFPAGVRAEQFRSSAKAYALIEANTGQIIAAERRGKAPCGRFDETDELSVVL